MERATRKTSRWKWTAAILGIAAFLLLVVFLLLRRAVNDVPEFYEEALAQETPVAERRQAASELEHEVLDLRNSMQRAEPWELTILEDEINAWIAEVLPRKFAGSLPPEVEQPRVAIREGKILLAFRNKAWLEGVVSLTLSPYLAETTNTIVVRIDGLNFGALPVPQKRIHDAISSAAAQSNLVVTWTEEDGVPVAIVTVPQAHSSLRNRITTITAFEVRERELYIAGTTEKKKK